MLLQRHHLLLVHLRVLEAHLGGCSGHQPLIVLDDLPSASLEEGNYLLNVLIVFLL